MVLRARHLTCRFPVALCDAITSCHEPLDDIFVHVNCEIDLLCKFTLDSFSEFPPELLPGRRICGRSSFVAQGNHGVDLDSASCWQVRREQGYEDQECSNTKNRDGIGGGHAEKKAGEDAT